MNNPQNKNDTLFPVCEYSARFGDYHAMDDASYWNTYFRSVEKRRPANVKNYEYTFLINPKQTKELAKTGAYFNPFHYPAYQRSVQPVDGPKPPVIDNIYDENILFQRHMAKYIVDKIKADETYENEIFVVNCDNQYPCVLLDFGMREGVATKRGWVNFLTILYVAIMNKLAYDSGMNIEMIRRSSFGNLRPSVSDCEPSMRINVGLIPEAYANLIVEGVMLLDKMLNISDCLDHFDEQIDLTTFKNKFPRYFANKNRSKKKGAPKEEIDIGNTVWDLLWDGCDFQSKSGMIQIGRHEKTIESIIDHILEQLIATPKTVSQVFEDATLFKQCFVHPFKNALESLTIEGTTVKITYKKDPIKFNWKTNGQPLPMDIKFRHYFPLYLRFFNQSVDQINAFMHSTKREDFFFQLEKIITHHIFHPPQSIADEDERAHGSDSEYEGDLKTSNKQKTHVHGLKLICATGMRAIQLAFYMIKYVKSEEIQKNSFASTASVQSMYFETEEALKDKHILQPPFNPREKYHNQHHPMRIPFFDLNHADVTQSDCAHELPVGHEFCVLDVTSSTTADMREALEKVFSDPTPRAVILVSSGLKHEQMMTDRNPYGTVRIFAKEKALCRSLYNTAIAQEENCHLKTHGQNKTPPVHFAYHHPKASDTLRKSMKAQGGTPTNRKILTNEIEPGYEADNESPQKPRRPGIKILKK